MKVKTFELVLIGHPDKICDRVSQVIANFNRDGRNAIECMWGNKLFIVSGETDYRWTKKTLTSIVRKVLKTEIGLTMDELNSLEIVNNLNVQSSEIDNIVGDVGTGDNGIFYGGYHRVYTPIILRMKELASSLNLKLLKKWGYRTDGKFIFTVDEKGNLKYFVLNIAKYADKEAKSHLLMNYLKDYLGEEVFISINPKGEWSKCFAFADTGLTGRKLACDGTCGLFSHGGGAIFGKDVSKADVTIPLFLNDLAEVVANRGFRKRKEVSLSAFTVIGDESVLIYKNDKLYRHVDFKDMVSYVKNKDLNVFGVLK